MALAGFVSANASPTFQDNCFDSEEAAEKHKNYFSKRDVDNSEASLKKTRALTLMDADDLNVSLQALENILGQAEASVDEATNHSTYKWELYFSGSPTAGDIEYSVSRGYCLDTRMAPFGVTSISWKPSFPDAKFGKATWYDFYG